MTRLDRDKKLQTSRIEEGDEVVLKISPHSWLKSGSTLKGEVTEAPLDDVMEWWREGNGRPMADIVVEGKIVDDPGDAAGDEEWPGGTVTWRYHIDNGYVTGPVDAPDRPSRSDIGRIRGFWPHSAVE